MKRRLNLYWASRGHQNAIRACCAVATLLFLTALPRPAAGRGGGGCLERGTMVLTPQGPVRVEDLKPGASVVTCFRGEVTTATVQSLMSVLPDTFYEIHVGNRVLRLTGEHPVATATGVFRIARLLQTGDRVLVANARSGSTCTIDTATIDAVRRLPAHAPAYNLLVSPGGTYFAGGVVVHNKGCFLPDTLVRKADGSEVAISSVRAGDRLLTFTEQGEKVVANVRSIMTHKVSEYRIVKTRDITVQVTPEHPFYVGDGTFKTIEALKPGDSIFAFDGQGLCCQPIQSITTVLAEVVVYNLQTDAPHTFLANGLLVHNKGGGGGGHGGGGHSGFGGGGYHGGYSGGYHGTGYNGSSQASSDDYWLWAPVVFVGAGFVLMAVVANRKMQARQQDLDFVYSRAQVARKADKTQKLLEFLARQDATMDPESLRKQTETTFLRLQDCWSTRSFEPMQPLLMPDLYRLHTLQLAQMVRQHEINLIADLHVERIDIVNLRYTLKEEQREFTALITATACDHYIDDRTHRWLRGDKAPARFQEFWTFHRLNKAWVLSGIEQSRESEALKEENFFEQFTDTGVEQIYGKAAAQQGQAGPWVERQVQTKETRIERMLNFLVQTDKLWNRQMMLETARRIFLELMAARESGEPVDAPDDDVFPELAAHFKEKLAQSKSLGHTHEFRNLCVRKVELVLVRNYADNSLDEYIARVRGHSQKIFRSDGQIVSQDEDVTPFEMYLTMGRHENRWKLKEILSAAAGEAAVRVENLDEDSTPEQVQWYYEHKRAM